MSLPRTVTASRAVAHGEVYEGDLALAQLPRLKESASGGGHLHARWQAGRNLAGQPRVEGKITGQIALTCQRCLERFDWPFEIEVELQLVHSEAEAAEVLQESEPYEVQDDALPLRDMVEDEVLLALPLMPRCKTCENAAPDAAPPEPEEPKRSNPFAALKKLKF